MKPKEDPIRILKCIWYSLGGLIFFSTFIWTANRKISGDIDVSVFNFFAFLGCIVMAIFIIMTIIVLIRWAVKNQF